MIFLHDKLISVKTKTSRLTERGQVSVPAVIRKEMGLQVGQRLRWERVADGECRVIVEKKKPQGAMSVLGFGAKLRKGKGRRTADWMRELREGE
jgi:AbrB family looped-hinge helix DNA binding protein